MDANDDIPESSSISRISEVSDNSSITYHDTEEKNWRQILVEFYSYYNPQKLSNVDNLLIQFKGKESLLLEQLEEKYCRNGNDSSSQVEEVSPTDRLSSIATELKKSLLVPRRQPDLSSNIRNNSSRSSSARLFSERGSTYRSSFMENMEEAADSAASHWKEERQNLITLIQDLKIAANDAFVMRNNMAGRLAVVERQENLLGMKLKEEQSKTRDLEDELRNVKAMCNNKHEQLIETIDAKNQLASEMDIILQQIPHDWIKHIETTTSEYPSNAEPQTLEQMLEVSRLSARMSQIEVERVQNLSRKQQKTLVDVQYKKESLCAELKDKEQTIKYLQKCLVDATSIVEEKDIKIHELKLWMTRVTEENEELNQKLKESLESLEASSNARESLISFFQNEKVSMQEYFALEISKVYMFVEEEKSKIITSTKEIKSAAELICSDETKAVKRELDVLMAELFRTRAVRAQLESEVAFLKNELAKAAEQLAIVDSMQHKADNVI